MQEFASLSDRTAVVTGSSSGIGRAIALEFARGGADLIVHCSTKTTAAEALANEIRGIGRKAEVVQANFSELSLLEEFVDRAWRIFGGVDLWVNNAGADVLTGPAADWSYEQKLERLLDVDVRANTNAIMTF